MVRRAARPSGVAPPRISPATSIPVPAKRRWMPSRCCRARTVVGGRQQHLPAGQRGLGGGAQGDLCLAEADVAADQPVHGASGVHVGGGGLDGGALARGERVREAAGQRGGAGMGRDGRRAGGDAGGGGGGQLPGVGLHLRLHLRPAALPGVAAQAGRSAVATQAPEAVQVPGGHQQLGTLGELQGHALLPVHVAEGGQAGDAVVLVHHQVAQAQRVGVGQRGGRGGSAAGGGGAEQRADGQQQQAGQARALRHVQQQDVDARLAGPGVRRLGVQAAAP